MVVESPPTVMGCPACGIMARSHGWWTVTSVDLVCFGASTRLWWRNRTLTLVPAGQWTVDQQDDVRRELASVLQAVPYEPWLSVELSTEASRLS